jgi:hypothetical protein
LLATKEQLPFQSFGMNRACYYLLVIAHFMFECYKRDVTPDVIPVAAYHSICLNGKLNFIDKSPERTGEVCLDINKINIISNLPCPNNTR